jgi:hypothetical protein
VAKDGNNRVPYAVAHLERFEVANLCVDPFPALGSQPLCFFDSNRAEVDRRDRVSLFREPDPVATVSVTDNERPSGWTRAHGLDEKVVGLITEGKTLFGVTIVP